jgi:hypothetical protein
MFLIRSMLFTLLKDAIIKLKANKKITPLTGGLWKKSAAIGDKVIAITNNIIPTDKFIQKTVLR